MFSSWWVKTASVVVLFIYLFVHVFFFFFAGGAAKRLSQLPKKYPGHNNPASYVYVGSRATGILFDVSIRNMGSEPQGFLMLLPVKALTKDLT